MIPLTKVHQTKPKYRKANKAAQAVRDFLARHTKAKKIVIDNSVNHQIWARGSSKPPRRVQVKAVEDSEGTVVASLLK